MNVYIIFEGIFKAHVYEFVSNVNNLKSQVYECVATDRRYFEGTGI